MFCKNCGKEVGQNAAVCLSCGVACGQGNNYCANCGAQVNPMAAVCVTCGSPIAHPINTAEQKSKIAAGLLGIFLGQFGVHNFYLGYTSKAVVQLVCTIVGYLLSCVGIGLFVVLGISIWALVEGIMILAGSNKTDAKGIPLKD